MLSSFACVVFYFGCRCSQVVAGLVWLLFPGRCVGVRTIDRRLKNYQYQY